MESLSFLLKLCLHIRVSIEGGEALRVSILRFSEQKATLLHLKLRHWINYFDQTGGENNAANLFESYPVQTFLEVLSQGLTGHSIYDRIKSAEEEILELCKDELQKELDKLPYLLMVPLLLFMFPAYLILLLGPILNLFIKEM